jgi:hypothetical protein
MKPIAAFLALLLAALPCHAQPAAQADGANKVMTYFNTYPRPERLSAISSDTSTSGQRFLQESGQRFLQDRAGSTSTC